MARMKEEDKDAIEHFASNYLNKEKYSSFSKLSNQDALTHFEFRAALYYLNKKREFCSYSHEDLCNHFSLIYSDQTHLITIKDIKHHLPYLRKYHSSEYKYDSNIAASSTTWRDLNALTSFEYLLFSEFKDGNEFTNDQVAEKHCEPIDDEIMLDTINLTIWLGADDEVIISSVKKLLKERRLKRNINNENQSGREFANIANPKLMMLCDLLLWCEVKKYPLFEIGFINKLIFENSITYDSVKENHLKRAKRLLDWDHILYLNTIVY